MTSSTRPTSIMIKYAAQVSLRCGVFVMLLVGLELSAAAQAAAARPERGVGPAGSYSVSDTGNVSLTNGNMSLSIPLAGLPPMAGGKLSWTLRAEYNSKSWDTVRAEFQTDPVDPASKYVASSLQLSGVSGWRVGALYSISFQDDDWDYDWLAPAPNDPEYNLLTQNRWTKVVLTTPDGAEHELRPVDYPSYPDGFGHHNHLRGYYKENPSSIGAAMRYYSFDGSYLWVKIDNSPYLFAGAAPSWTLHLPDGTKVEQLTSGIQRITDTNGNKVKAWSETTAAGVTTTHYQDELTDREVKYVYNPAGNGGKGQGQAQYQTVGSVWVSVDVNFDTTRVHGKRYEFGDPECADAADYVDAEIGVVRSIVLPQTEPNEPRRQFTFTYNSDATDAVGFQWRPNCGAYQTVTQASHGWGSLSRMETPSGAKVDYAYALDGDNHYLPSNPDDAPRERLTSKTIDYAGPGDLYVFNYSLSPVSSGMTSPDGSSVTEMRYPSDPAFARGYFSIHEKSGLVYRTNQSDKVIVERHWRSLPFTGGDNSTTGSLLLASFNPVVDAEYTTLKENGQAVKMSAKTYAHDYNGNVTEVKEYDWFDPALVTRDAEGVPTGVPAGAVLLRTTTTGYHNSPGTSASSSHVYAKRQVGATTPSIYNAMMWTAVGDGEARFSYDDQAYGFAPTAGNVTQVSRRDDKGDSDPNNDTWPTTTTVYGPYGNPSSTTDPNNRVTEFFYDDLTHALPTRVVVNPLNGTGAQTTQTAYDFSTGLVTSTTDPNGQTSDVSYVNQLTGAVDPFGRPGVVTGPAVEVGGVTQRRKVFTFYEDASRRVRVESDLNAEGDRLLKSRTTSDKLGRVVLAEQSENGSTYTISAQTVYAQAGRVTLKSYPTRGDGSSPDGWTRVTADSLGRTVEAATFAGATQPSATAPANQIANWTGSVTSSYWANETTVADQANRTRKSVTDALGRLAQVVEAPGVPGYGFVTGYAYDALGNLRKVDQGGQLRFFMYDSLSRLIRAKNPEQGAFAADVNFPALTDSSSGTANAQWSTGYLYDAAGNLTKKKDARGVVATYGYDGLNRNTSVVYSGETGTPTPNVTRTFDGATLGKGRLWKSESAQTGLTTVEGYDAAGRPLGQSQSFWVNGAWGAPYTVSYAYDLAGNLKTQTYPSDHSVSYAYDAAGRLNSFTGNLGDGAPRTYSTGIAYDASGRVRQEQFGTQTPVYNKRLYNGRNQLAEIRVSTHSLFEQGHQTDWNRGAIINHYSTSGWGATGGGPDNNGNLLRQEVYVPNDDQISGYYNAVQYYGYDALNRLASVEEKLGNATTQFTQAYQYDRWGNRTILQAGTSNAPAPQYTASAATNRLTPPAGSAMTYDPAGNLTYDNYRGGQGGGGTMTYDAEGRMTSAQFLAGQTQTASYTYDADGRRVKRKAGVVAEVWQVYGMGGELLAEYAPGALSTQPQKEYGYRGGELLVTAEPAAPATLPTSAEEKVTPVSVTASGSYSASQGPEKAVDGNASTIWLSGGFPGQWLQFDLGQVRKLTRLRLRVAQSPAGRTVHQVYGGATPASMTLIATVDSTTQDGQWLEVQCNGAEARYVKVSTSVSPSWVGWYEVEAYADTAVKLAPVGATASNSYSAASGPDKAVDGNPSTVWNAGGYPEQWLQLDLGAACAVTKVRLRVSQSPAGPSVHQVYGGPTSSQLTLLGTISSTTQDGQWVELTAAATNVRYVRVRTTSNPSSWVSWYEAEVYGRAPAAGGGVGWLVADQLGTPRMVVDQTGNLASVSRHDYLPFGEELYAGTGGRMPTQGYSAADNVRQKFTSYERDEETKLDYAQARYFASAQGRFTSPDPLLSSGRVENPQSWNRFSYTLNNPLKYTDPLGMFEWLDGDNNSKEENKRREKFLKAYENLKKLREKVLGKLGDTSEEYKRLDKVIKTIGELGDGNKVRIEFGETITEGAAGEAEGPITDFTADKTYDKNNDYYKITLDLEGARGDHLVETIGHEGQHIVDLMAGLRKEGGYNTYPLEFNAFEVSSFIQEAQGRSIEYRGGGGRIWRKEWAELDRQTIQANRKEAINKFLSTNTTYKKRASPPR